MKQTILFLSLFLLSVTAFPQSQPVKPSAITGEAKSVSESTIELVTKDGSVIVSLTPSTEFKRVPPENPTLKAAVAAALTDISVGDKLLVTGILAADKKSIPAKAVYVMTKTDIAQRAKAESQRWATRGVSGRVTEANPATGQLMLEVRGLSGSQSVTLTPKADAKFLRYKQDSVSYSEAVPSTINDIKAGDMLRALGDRSSDGTSFTAEEVITGSFKTVAGTVKSIDAAANEVVITDLATSKDVTIVIGASSALKKIPDEMVQRLAGTPGAAGSAGSGAPQGRRPAAVNGGPPAGGLGERSPGANGERAGGMRGGRGGIDDMFERFPLITVADIKVGDMVAVSSSKNGSETKITAIKLLAGVEPFVRAAQSQSNAGGRGRGGSQQGGFTIPGLDGFDFP